MLSRRGIVPSVVMRVILITVNGLHFLDGRLELLQQEVGQVCLGPTDSLGESSEGSLAGPLGVPEEPPHTGLFAVGNG